MPLGVDDRLERLVVDDDPLRGAARLLRMLGGDDRDGLAEVADAVDREHRLVGELEPVRLLPGTSACVRTACTPGSVSASERSIERTRACAWGLRNVAPEHSRGGKVARVRELARRLGNAVRALDALADAPEHELARPRDAQGLAHRAAARRTASKIFV